MSDVRLGVTLPQFTDDPERIVEAARHAEDCGLDSVWLFDHMWPLTGGKERPIMEQWSTLSVVAASTRSIAVGTMVTRSTLRHPSVLAKMAATVGAVAPGRVTVTIGSGDRLSRAENEAFDLPYFSGPDRVAQFRSELEVVLAYLRGTTVSHHNRFVSIDDLPVSPRPEPRPSVWVGGKSPSMLEAAAALADGWNGWGGTPVTFAEDSAWVMQKAGDRRFEVSWGGVAVLTADDDGTWHTARSGRPHVAGGPRTVARFLSDMADAGATHLILTFPRTDRAVYERLAGPVRDAMGIR